MTTFVLVDDHALVRRGVRQLLEQQAGWEVVGEADDGLDGLHLVETLRPDVAILDLSLPCLPGLELLAQARRRVPTTRFVVLSMHQDVGYAAQALRAGAGAYVTKAGVADELLRAVRAVLAGRRFVGDPHDLDDLEEVVERVAAPSCTDLLERLTPREREVYYLTAGGRSVKATADALTISPRTVEVHRQRIYAKLGVRDQRALMADAHDRGLLEQLEPPASDSVPRGAEGPA